MTVTDEKTVADDLAAVAGTTVSPAPARRNWTRLLAFGILPAFALLLTVGAGYAKWRGDSIAALEADRVASVQAARDGGVAMLAYTPSSVEADLNAARDRLTGEFRESYSALIDDVVIPGSQQRNISSEVTIAAAGSASVDGDRAVVLLFVDQTTTIGDGAPTQTASAVRVTLDRVGNDWRIAGFDPV